MRYGRDFRCAALNYVRMGGSQTDAACIFGISRKTLYRWLQDDRDWREDWRGSYKSKLDKAALEAHVQDYPDSLLRERAEHFKVSHVTIWHALKKLKTTHKKNDEVSGSQA